MRVLKFGGTSVRDAEWMARSLNIAQEQISEGIVLVSSAMAKTTNGLQDIACRAEQTGFDEARRAIEELEAHHLATAEALLEGEPLDRCRAGLEELFSELVSVVKGLSLLKERSPRSNDLILSFGERLSTTILAETARARGIETKLVDAREFMKTDDAFTHASLIEETTYRLVREKVRPRRGRLIVTQGFIASTETGITTTLGRNQSDFTAIVLGAALEADEVQIWTDVDGIMTCDPRLVPEAATLPSISYREAAELAYFGAKVIHPQAIQPAVTAGIPICVKNTGRPQSAGTRIVSDIPSEGPKAIAFKEGITVVNVTSARMLHAYGFLKTIFEIFELYKTPVDLVATSEVSVSMTIDEVKHLDAISGRLGALGSVGVARDLSIICLVGQGLWKNSRIISRVFSTLEEVPIRLVTLGSSDTNLSVVVPREKTAEAVRSLHSEFFERGGG